MSVLDSFLSTWSGARESFGRDAPQGGAPFDASTTWSALRHTVESADPGQAWSGTAASAYGTANTDQLDRITRLAELDRRLGRYLDQSARAVATGRAELDALKGWVLDAAASIPPGADRDAALLPIVSKGLRRLREIIAESHEEIAAVGDLLGDLRGEYEQTAGRTG